MVDCKLRIGWKVEIFDPEEYSLSGQKGTFITGLVTKISPKGFTVDWYYPDRRSTYTWQDYISKGFKIIER